MHECQAALNNPEGEVRRLDEPPSDPISCAAGAKASSSRGQSRSGRLRSELMPDEGEWLNQLQHYSQWLMAAIAPQAFEVVRANDAFYQLFQGPSSEAEITGSWCDRLVPPDLAKLQHLYRQHLLFRVLQDFCEVDLSGLRFPQQSVVVGLRPMGAGESRFAELWLDSRSLQLERIDAEIDEFAELASLSVSEIQARLRDPAQLQQCVQQLHPKNYRVRGWLLLEGLEVTIHERIQHLSRLLINQDSILRSEKFRQVSQELRSLFRADNNIILSAEGDQARLSIGTEYETLQATVYPMQSLRNSCLMQAAETNQVCNIPDLAQRDQTEFEQQLLALGVQSLLLIPLVVKATEANLGSRQLVGLVGLTSDRPHNFDSVDCHHATELIPALTMALRQAVQQRLTTLRNIHPAVEWKFLQEAERQSWGLPAQPIVFSNVYPLYGISDIRGSSDERNRAIQADLLEQFRLGLAVVEAVCQQEATALGQQLRLDLLDYIEQLQTGITVDAEITALRYLSDRLEVYFDYFSQCSVEANVAVEAYRAACNNVHQAVYAARDRYDQMIDQINTLLRTTWEQWQIRMQQITSHYCDTECTDGIDHMIYAGTSIDPKFCAFHLRSLRYEQLRAVCDCARAAFTIQAQYATKMEVTHLVLIQDVVVDIFHDETTENLFDVRGTRDTRYEIVKKRIDKAVDQQTKTRITQPGMLTLVYSTDEEWAEYQQYLRYLIREQWIDTQVEFGTVEPLQGVNGLKYARVRILG